MQGPCAAALQRPPGQGLIHHGVVVLDAFVDIVHRELDRCELTTIVRTQHPQIAATLLRGCLEYLDGVCRSST